MPDVVVDASAFVDLLLEKDLGLAIRHRLRGEQMHAPSHMDGEVLSALGRVYRAGLYPAARVRAMLAELAAAPIVRHPLPDLVVGAWARRERVRLVDAVYLELADRLDAPLLTTDARLRAEARVEVVRA